MALVRTFMRLRMSPILRFQENRIPIWVRSGKVQIGGGATAQGASQDWRLRRLKIDHNCLACGTGAESTECKKVLFYFGGFQVNQDPSAEHSEKNMGLFRSPLSILLVKIWKFYLDFEVILRVFSITKVFGLRRPPLPPYVGKKLPKDSEFFLRAHLVYLLYDYFFF